MPIRSVVSWAEIKAGFCELCWAWKCMRPIHECLESPPFISQFIQNSQLFLNTFDKLANLSETKIIGGLTGNVGVS